MKTFIYGLAAGLIIIFLITQFGGCGKDKPVVIIPKTDSLENIIAAQRTELAQVTIENNRKDDTISKVVAFADSLQNLVDMYQGRSEYKGGIITGLIAEVKAQKKKNIQCDSLANTVESAMVDVKHWQTEVKKVKSADSATIIELYRKSDRLAMALKNSDARLQAYAHISGKIADTLKAQLPKASPIGKFYIGAALSVPGLNVGPKLIYITPNDRVAIDAGTLFGTSGQIYQVGAHIKISFHKPSLLKL